MPDWELVFAGAALAVLITQGTLFQAFREHGPPLWRELWKCPLCLGWWTGAAGAALHGGFGGPLEIGLWYVAVTGALSGVLALLFRRIVDWLDGNTP